jgi:putative lipoic acid-binding regulatory protein
MSELISFPCVFPVKVMGANLDDFVGLVVGIIQKHASISQEELVTTRLSRNSRFLSVTVHINAESQDQLDAIYQELSAHERVLMML